MGRKKYSKELKAQIALDAIKGQKTISRISNPNMAFMPIRSVLEEAVT